MEVFLRHRAKFICELCGVEHFMLETCFAEFNEGIDGVTLCMSPAAWLKKIDPPALPETVDTDSEVTA